MLDRIEADLKSALLAGDKTIVAVLRGVKSALNNAAIAKRTKLTDEEIVVVLRREAKQRDEATAVYEKGGAKDRAEAEAAEKLIIERYLPARLDEATVTKLIEQAIAEIGVDKAKIGQIIGRVMQLANGQADGKTVARLVNQKI